MHKPEHKMHKEMIGFPLCLRVLLVANPFPF
jgi:hypothetical protein